MYFDSTHVRHLYLFESNLVWLCHLVTCRNEMSYSFGKKNDAGDR